MHQRPGIGIGLHDPGITGKMGLALQVQEVLQLDRQVSMLPVSSSGRETSVASHGSRADYVSKHQRAAAAGGCLSYPTGMGY